MLGMQHNVELCEWSSVSASDSGVVIIAHRAAAPSSLSLAGSLWPWECTALEGWMVSCVQQNAAICYWAVRWDVCAGTFASLNIEGSISRLKSTHVDRFPYMLLYIYVRGST